MKRNLQRVIALALTIVLASGLLCDDSLASQNLSTQHQTKTVSVEHKEKRSSVANISGTSKLVAQVDPDSKASTTFEEESNTLSGKCGENVFWEFDGVDTLTIYGAGPMYDYGVQDGSWVDQPYAAWQFDIVNVVIEDGVTRIGDYAFEEYYEISDVEIADTVETIGYAAFLDCSMEDVTLPKDISYIGEYAFGYFTDIEEIMLDPDFTIYGYTYSIAETYAKDNDIYFVSIGTRDAPTKGKCGKSAQWSYKKSSYTLTISGSGKMYDYGWDDSTEIYNDTPWYIYSLELEKVVFKDGITNIGNAALAGCWYLDNASIPSSVTSIGEYSFNACDHIEKVKLPSKVTTIGEGAFDTCLSLYSINIPTKVKSIGTSAFYDCDIAIIEIPRSVTSIGKKAFGYFYDEDDEEEYIDADFIIKGFSGSSANTYAKKNDIHFVKMDAPKISSVKNKSSKKIVITWKKESGITGYQIQYSTSSKFKSAKTITVSSYKTTSKTISKLKKKKKYYVRIRTYKKINGKAYYSNWSGSKSVTIKK